MSTNRFFDAQKFNRNFKFNNLNGLNNIGGGYSKIQIIGQLDHFTKKTLYENYDIIAKNLKVYPTIKIYPRGYELEGGFGGLYHSSNNHIDMIDHYYLISILAHEMRHAFQYIYFPNLYFNTEYSSAREYLNCSIERDARGYSIDYCKAREYWEEVEFLEKDEEQIQLVLHKKLSPSVRGLNDDYFRQNPSKAHIVSRTYHFEQNSSKLEELSSDVSHDSSETALGCLKSLAKASLIIFIIYRLLVEILG